VEETTGRQESVYIRDSIKGTKILKIHKDRVVIEREGKIFVLRVGGVTNSENSHSDTYTENRPHFTVYQRLSHSLRLFTVRQVHQ
jgi:type II secretory pathway component PulC